MAFISDIKLFTNGVNDKADKLFRSVALELTRRVILKTPVDSGRARASWEVARNSVPRDVQKALDPSGGKAISQAESRISSADAQDVIYIINNLPYIEKLEDGSSKQAPQGMVKTTVKEFQGIVKDKTRG